MPVLVEVNAEGHTAPVALLEQAVRAVFDDADVSDAEVSLTLLSDGPMAELHRDYLGKEKTTDVLSFALEADGRLVGDLYIGFEQATRQAEEAGVALDEELTRLAVHGALHVIGHDHPDGEDRLASPMFEVQERLVRALMGGR